MRTIIAGAGQPVAGDDGVGLAVLDELRRRALPAGLELLHLRDPAALIGLFETEAKVVVVDALLAPPAGRVLVLKRDALGSAPRRPSSSHGIDVADALALAEALHPVPLDLRIVAVTIARPEGVAFGLSPAVRTAVPRAANLSLLLLGA